METYEFWLEDENPPVVTAITSFVNNETQLAVQAFPKALLAYLAIVFIFNS